MGAKSNLKKLLEAQTETRCAVLHLMTAVSEMHTAMTLPHSQQRKLLTHANSEVVEAQRALYSVLVLMQKKHYRPRLKKVQAPKKQPTTRPSSTRAMERRDARRPVNG